MESLITEHWAIMGRVDTRHRVKLVVDEWGAWHGTTRGLEPTDGEVKAGGSTFVYRFAPASVTRLRMSLV